MKYMGVSKNNGTPQIIHFNRVFHYKPSILGFWKHPYRTYFLQYAWLFNISVLPSHEHWLAKRHFDAPTPTCNKGICRNKFPYEIHDLKVGTQNIAHSRVDGNILGLPFFGEKSFPPMTGTIARWWVIHPWRLTWNIIMEVWKIIFLSKWVICMFHANLPGCKSYKTNTRNQRRKTHVMNLLKALEESPKPPWFASCHHAALLWFRIILWVC